MKTIHWLWAVLALVYISFFSWYTSFGGPLTEEEIEHYVDLMEQGKADPMAIARIRKFMEEDTGDDFVMVNVIDMYDTPLQIEGVEPGETSDEVQAKYMEYMFPALFSRACHPMFFGSAAAPALDLMNATGMEVWDAGAGMRYRSRRDMFEITFNQEFQGRHEFKVASMAKTIAFPVDPWFHFGDPRLLLALLLGLIGSLLSWRISVRRG